MVYMESNIHPTQISASSGLGWGRVFASSHLSKVASVLCLLRAWALGAGIEQCLSSMSPLLPGVPNKYNSIA